MGGARPSREDLARFATDATDVTATGAPGVDDVLPAAAGSTRLLIVGVNPGLWTAAVNAPFARPGNRFWPSLHRAGLTDHVVDASTGLSEADEAQLLSRGIGLTNLVGRATARADELTRDELRAGAERVTTMAAELRPAVVAVAGITAFRTAFARPRATYGPQDTADITSWPREVALWVLPQPSGLNAHETPATLAEHWRRVWAEVQARTTGPSG